MPYIYGKRSVPTTAALLLSESRNYTGFMRHSLFFYSCLLPALCCLTSATQGEVFVLTTGGAIEGVWLNKDQSPRKDYAVQVMAGGRVLLDKSQVADVIVKTDGQLWYDKVLPRMPDTLAGHWQMSEECQKRKLTVDREFHLNEVLRFDPNHEGARHALGYSRVDGKWARQEDIMAKRGYVRFQNKWRLPQEVDIESRGEDQETKEGEWRKKIRMWRGWIVRGRDRVSEAEKMFREIRDPYAAKPLSELLEDDKEAPALKLLYIDVLSGLPAHTSVAALIKRAMNDPDLKVRDRALDGLAKSGARDVIPALVKALKHDKNPVVHRAAQVLGRLKAYEATLPLIDALTTKHKQQVGGSSGQTTAGFDKTGSGGPGGLSMGGGAKIVEFEVQNDPVLAALTAMYSGVNFGYNKDAWRKWYAHERAPTEISLRRTE